MDDKDEPSTHYSCMDESNEWNAFETFLEGLGRADMAPHLDLRPQWCKQEEEFYPKWNHTEGHGNSGGIGAEAPPELSCDENDGNKRELTNVINEIDSLKVLNESDPSHNNSVVVRCNTLSDDGKSPSNVNDTQTNDTEVEKNLATQKVHRETHNDIEPNQEEDGKAQPSQMKTVDPDHAPKETNENMDDRRRHLLSTHVSHPRDGVVSKGCSLMDAPEEIVMSDQCTHIESQSLKIKRTLSFK